MARLVDCGECGALSCLESIRPVYHDGAVATRRRSAQIVGIEQDIDCPECGRRTQIIVDAASPN
jgi:hypothetical protein